MATSNTLAAGIKKIGEFDLILCGKQAIDGDTAQVGPEMAEHLGLPQVTYASKMTVEGNIAKITRELDEELEVIEVQLPVLVTVVKSMNEPRMATVRGTMKANRTEIPTYTAKDLDVDLEKIGFKGSPTQVRKIFPPPVNDSSQMIDAADARTAAAILVEKLTEAKII